MVSIEELAAECNFPELLVRDLEDSEAVFASKSMTAGCPFLGLASSGAHGPPLVTDMGMGRISSEVFGLDEPRSTENSSDSASESSVGAEPAPVRTREQSFTTTATSVCSWYSSSHSHKPASPSSPASASSKPFSSQGTTWFDGDDELDFDMTSDTRPGTGNSSSTSDSMAPSSYRQTRFVWNAIEAKDMIHEAFVSNTASRPATANAPPRAYLQPASDRRPHTSAGRPRMERPRLIDIQPPVAVPHRLSSMKAIYHEKLSPLQFTSSESDQSSEQDSRHYGGPLTSHPPMLFLTASCGRTLIDASKPSSIDLDDREPAQHHLPSTDTQSDGDAVGGSVFIFGEEEQEQEPNQPGHQKEQPGHLPSSWMAPMETGSGLNIQPFAPRTENHSPTTTTGGIPLPPEVVETLRISIACFPETMLLTSSLSVETIRTYSKKLKHRHKPAIHRRLSDDNDSVFSFSSSTKRSSRWGFNKLIQGRRGKQKSQSTASLPRIEDVETEPVRSPMMSNWTPIKNIFTTGSDYICDALYAHIVAYNYINTLCPLPTLLPTQTTRGPGDSEDAHGPDGRNNAKVPRKAASILGLQESAKAHKAGVSASPQRTHSRKLGSVSSNESTLRDIQTGLGRCIALLVATLKQTGRDSRGFDGSLRLAQGNEVETLDPLLIRSLCEAVRCSEEVLNC